MFFSKCFFIFKISYSTNTINNFNKFPMWANVLSCSESNFFFYGNEKQFSYNKPILY